MWSAAATRSIADVISSSSQRGDGTHSRVPSERRKAIEDEVLQALDPQQRAMLWQLLTRALYGAEPALRDQEPDPVAATPAG